VVEGGGSSMDVNRMDDDHSTILGFDVRAVVVGDMAARGDFNNQEDVHEDTVMVIGNAGVDEIKQVQW